MEKHTPSHPAKLKFDALALAIINDIPANFTRVVHSRGQEFRITWAYTLLIPGDKAVKTVQVQFVAVLVLRKICGIAAEKFYVKSKKSKNEVAYCRESVKIPYIRCLMLAVFVIIKNEILHMFCNCMLINSAKNSKMESGCSISMIDEFSRAVALNYFIFVKLSLLREWRFTIDCWRDGIYGRKNVGL